MYWEFKFKPELFKPHAKQTIMFRVKAFLASSSRINGKVKKDRTYIGTIIIYGQDHAELTQQSILKVFGDVKDVLSFGNYSHDSIMEFLEKGVKKFDKCHAEAREKLLEDTRAEMELLYLGSMVKQHMNELEANSRNQTTQAE